MLGRVSLRAQHPAEPPQEYQRAIVERVFALARREAKFGVIGADVVEQTVRQAAEAAR